MSYLYLAKYNRKSNTFELGNSPNTDTFAIAIYNTLAKYNGERSREDDELLEFYIAYHPDFEFYQNKKRKVFCQYIFIRDKERQAALINSDKDLFLDKDFNIINGDKKEFLLSIKILPIIHITSLDLFNEKIERDIFYKIPKYIRIVDSSIWNLYVPLRKAESNYNFTEQLKKQIEKIYQCKEFYPLNISLENVDLHARLVSNSYLSGGEHSDNAVPFLFHSETEMQKKSQEKLHHLQSYDKKLEWRILLLDDHSKKILDSDNITRSGVTKTDVIISILKEYFNILSSKKIECTGKNCYGTIEIECVETICEAKDKILLKRYDIIFLDYLLGKKGGNVREYGYELLENINDVLDKENKWEKAKGIFRRFWLFNISSFSHAIEESLRERGLGYHTANWHFSRGASPIMAQELFKYELFRFLIRQIEVITELPFLLKDKKTIQRTNEINKSCQGEEEASAINKKRLITPIDLLQAIYCANSNKIRENAVTYFNSILAIKAKYRILMQDYYYPDLQDKNSGNGSPLVKSLFSDLKDYKNAFWEHLMHLVYVTAYGTIRQWPEMWEESLYIKDYILKTNDGKKENEVIDAIEKYIIKLKNANV